MIEDRDNQEKLAPIIIERWLKDFGLTKNNTIGELIEVFKKMQKEKEKEHNVRRR